MIVGGCIVDIKHMKYFVEVVKQGGMTNASKALFIAQPTIRNAIKDIESELEMPLFDRKNRQLILTDAGQIFYKKSEEILNLYSTIPAEMKGLSQLDSGHINIGMSAVMNVNHFIRILGEFHQLYPNVTYNLNEHGGKYIEENLDKGTLDIGITTLPVDAHRFNSLALYKEELVLVVSKDHPFAQQESVLMSDLKDEDFILFNEDFYLNDKIIEAAKNNGFIPHAISNISQWKFIEDLLIAHLGVSILPKSIVNMLSDRISSVNIKNPTMIWELGVIWMKDKTLSHATKRWVDFMQAHLK